VVAMDGLPDADRIEVALQGVQMWANPA